MTLARTADDLPSASEVRYILGTRVDGAGANLLLLCSAVAFSLLLAELALLLFYLQKMRIEFDAYAGVPVTRYYGLRPNYRKRFSHYTNLGKMDGRLRRLLRARGAHEFPEERPCPGGTAGGHHSVEIT
jgi:hypothetical protein